MNLPLFCDFANDVPDWVDLPIYLIFKDFSKIGDGEKNRL
jgi:hypothetical protein